MKAEIKVRNTINGHMVVGKVGEVEMKLSMHRSPNSEAKAIEYKERIEELLKRIQDEEEVVQSKN